jgi:hypothetical protein
MNDPGYFKDMEIVDNRLKKLESQVSTILIMINKMKDLIERKLVSL